MAFLFDFGVSQEDPRSELKLLAPVPGDRVLSLASAGEVPLSIAATCKGVKVTAVDISPSQIYLCRLKLTVALEVPFPANKAFLGYSYMKPAEREKIYADTVADLLPQADREFWNLNMKSVRKGIVNAGRFEQYIDTMRSLASLFIGRKNLVNLVGCVDIEDQVKLFDSGIATRRALRMLFRIAFHPAIYRKRGLQEKALIHADSSTGERFYSKFRDFCTATPAAENYFLQFFLTGGCKSLEACPDYLLPANREQLGLAAPDIELETISFQEILRLKPAGTFNKVHMSNLGDWLSSKEYSELSAIISRSCAAETVISYRFLQKNHTSVEIPAGFTIDPAAGEETLRNDRFPFYGIIRLSRRSQ